MFLKSNESSSFNTQIRNLNINKKGKTLELGAIRVFQVCCKTMLSLQKHKTNEDIIKEI